MTESTQPKRLQSIAKEKKETQTKTPKDVEFKFPKFELNLSFFLEKGSEKFTPKTLIEKAFGEIGESLTAPEQVFLLLRAMEDLEVVAPLKFECEHCSGENPIALNLPKVMQPEGRALSHFFVEFTSKKSGKHYIFEFERPAKIIEIDKIESTMAASGLFLLQWLSAHNQGEDFDVLKLPIADFLELAERFGNKMFSVNFETKFKCHHCKKMNSQEFGVTLEDLTAILNEF